VNDVTVTWDPGDAKDPENVCVLPSLRTVTVKGVLFVEPQEYFLTTTLNVPLGAAPAPQ
jgi:hypothetical protein